jgi:hypothetical protein
MEKDSSISLLDKIVEVTNSLQPDSLNEIREKLILLINELINKDFQALLQLLYRIDVNEKKIRLYLNEKTNEDSANVLANMIIERQLQKIETRKKFKLKNKRKNDEEKW